MPKVAIYGQVMSSHCQNRKTCQFVSIDQFQPIESSNDDAPVKNTVTIGDYNPVTKKWE
jgi:hypothetical protein